MRDGFAFKRETGSLRRAAKVAIFGYTPVFFKYA